MQTIEAALTGRANKCSYILFKNWLRYRMYFSLHLISSFLHSQNKHQSLFDLHILFSVLFLIHDFLNRKSITIRLKHERKETTSENLQRLKKKENRHVLSPQCVDLIQAGPRSIVTSPPPESVTPTTPSPPAPYPQPCSCTARHSYKYSANNKGDAAL